MTKGTEEVTARAPTPVLSYITPASRARTRAAELLEQAGMLFVLLLLLLGCSILVPHFATFVNLKGLGMQVSAIGLVSCTMLFCLAGGDFDLSVGTVLPCAGVVAALVTNRTGSFALGLTAALAVGAMVGLVNGLVVGVLRINALITTLATMQMVKGLGLLVTGGLSVSLSNAAFLALANSSFLSIQTPIWLCVIFFAVFGFLIDRTTFGRNTLAVGGNPEAARLAGIGVARLKVLIFTVQGVVAAFAGVVLASHMGGGFPNSSQGFELDVIAACVLGGVSLTGGVGKISYVIAGVLIMGVVQNAMSLLSIDPFYQYVVRGAILLAAVIFDRLKQRGSR